MEDHRLEHIHQGNVRWRCVRCKQTWTKSPTSRCPEVPVLAAKDPHFQTLTALEKARKYPLDATRPDAAYRLLRAPYYGWLYDERLCIHRPLTDARLNANEKRRTTMRARYGCRLCNRHYAKADQDLFRDCVCPTCQANVRDWNELIAWSRQMIEDGALVLHLETAPRRAAPRKLWHLPASAFPSHERLLQCGELPPVGVCRAGSLLRRNTVPGQNHQEPI